MKELERINKRLEELKCNLKIIIDKVYSYDNDCYKYDAWIVYFSSRMQKWSVLHVLGKFSNERYAIDSAKDYLHINHYKF